MKCQILSLSLALVVSLNGLAFGQDLTIRVDASDAKTRAWRTKLGSCLEDVNHEVYGGIYSQMIFGEHFQEPPPRPAIEGFRQFAGDWRVESGEVSVDAKDGPKLIANDVEFRDGRISVEVFLEKKQGQNAGIIARVRDAGPGADRFTGYEISLCPERQVLTLGRHQQNWEHIRDTPCEVPIGKWVALEAVFAGPKFEVFVDGKSIDRFEDKEHPLSAGAIGLRGWHSQPKFRNLSTTVGGKVRQLPLAAAAPLPQVSGMWSPVSTGTANGSYELVAKEPLVGQQSQRMEMSKGAGECGVFNRGLNRQGMHFVGGKEYQGVLWARAEKSTSVWVALESSDGKQRLAEKELEIAPGGWKKVEFSLTPSAGASNGRFSVLLKKPGAVTLGYARLEPGEWGRFEKLPVRKDVAEGLMGQGVEILRYGGCMANCDQYRWKDMIGPPEKRPPFVGFWYPHSSNGWNLVDFMNFCEAAQFEYVPNFSINESPQDMTDFVEYAFGGATTKWGAKRVEDGHAAPYRLKAIQLGNEEKVNDEYLAKFTALARAVWSKKPDLILVVGDFLYTKKITDPYKIEGAAGGITTLAVQEKIMALAKEFDAEVWFDIHLVTEGIQRDPTVEVFPSFVDAIDKLSHGAKHKVVVFELNSNNHSLARALSNAVAIHAIERDGRIPICTVANCLQPDGQNDNGWNQGLLFLNPEKVWLQPPGYLNQMMAANRLPRIAHCEVSGGQGTDVLAKRSEDGKVLSLQVVNTSDQPQKARLEVIGFTPQKKEASIRVLSGELSAANTASKTDAIAPRSELWKHGGKLESAEWLIPARSFSVIRLE